MREREKGKKRGQRAKRKWKKRRRENGQREKREKEEGEQESQPGEAKNQAHLKSFAKHKIQMIPKNVLNKMIIEYQEEKVKDG